MKKYILILIAFTSNFISIAQWANGGGVLNRWGNGSFGPPTTQWRSFGMGDFSANAATPQARLHINEFYLLSPWTGTNGNIFRTDGSDAIVNQWQLYTGATANTTNQKFRIFVPSNLSDVGLHSREDMFFMTGPGTLAAPAIERMRIHENSGNIAIGTPWVDPNIRMSVIQNAQNQGVSTNPNIYDIMFQGRISDDTLSNIRLMNGTSTDNYLVPQLAGYNSNATIGGPLSPRFQGLALSGAISFPADAGLIGLGSTAVVEFDARKRSPDGTLQAAVTRRDLFQWCNFNILEMLMNARGQLGINQANPTNRLEITTRAVDPFFSSANGSSGLKFTNMTNLNIPVPNSGNMGVLSVDAVGNVIYVNGGTGTIAAANNGASLDLTGTTVQLGNNVGLTTAQLINNREIPTNNFNIMFNDVANSNSSIGIGHPLGTNSTTVGKFEVTTDTKIIGGVFNAQTTAGTPVTGVYGQASSTGTGNVTGVNGVSLGSNGVGNSIGVNGISIGATGIGNAIGVNGTSISNSNTVIAINGNARNATSQTFAANLDVLNSTSPQNYGVQVEVLGGTNASSLNFGGQFVVGNSGTTNYGVYARAYGATTNWAGYFDGDVFINGQGTGSLGQFYASDNSIKTNISNISNVLSILNQVPVKSFYYDTLNSHNLKLSASKQYGVIAQDIESILPELVSETTKPADYDTLGNIINPAFTYKTVNYNAFIGLLIKSTQEQQSQLNSKDSAINSLNDRLIALENCINGLNLCGNPQAVNTINNSNINATITNVDLKDGQSIVLEQNVPNPFAEQTTINYFLPDDVKKAQLLFYNAQGKLIQTLDLTQKGKGSINVFAQDLSTGVYTYTLVADGQIVETKKMVKN